MKPIIALVMLFAISCGGTQKNTSQENVSASDEPIWEEVDDAAYKFYRSVSKTLLRTNQPKQATESIRRLFKLKPEDPEPPLSDGAGVHCHGAQRRGRPDVQALS